MAHIMHLSGQTDLGTLDGYTYFQAIAMNEKGQIIGSMTTPEGILRGFFWSKGTMTDLGSLGGTSLNVEALNNSGKVVGYSKDDKGYEQAFVWYKGNLEALETIGTGESYAHDINNSGKIVGAVQPSSNLFKPASWSGVRNKLTEIQGFEEGKQAIVFNISDSGTMVGLTRTKANRRQAVYIQTANNITDIGLLGYFTTVVKVNSLGDVVANGRSKTGGFGNGFYLKK
jgi:probable HAF family extracellular repeat protein